MKIAILLSLLLCLTISCQAPPPAANTVTNSSFFDLELFIQKEVKRLETNILAINKTVTINDKKESKRIDSLNIKEELAFISDMNINRPTWLEKYQIDSIWDEQRLLKEVSYTALRNQLKVKEMHVYFKDHAVSGFEIHKKVANKAIRSSEQINYYTGKGYAIQKEQAFALSNPQTLSISVEYILRKKR